MHGLLDLPFSGSLPSLNPLEQATLEKSPAALYLGSSQMGKFGELDSCLFDSSINLLRCCELAHDGYAEAKRDHASYSNTGKAILIFKYKLMFIISYLFVNIFLI